MAALPPDHESFPEFTFWDMTLPEIVLPPVALHYLATLYQSDQLWRMLMDARYQNSDVFWKMFEGPLYYVDKGKPFFSDKKPAEDAIIVSKGEPGYAKAVFTGWSYCLKNLGNHMTSVMWEELHEILIAGVGRTLYADDKHTHGFREELHQESAWRFLVGKNGSKEGLAARLLDICECAEPGFFFGYRPAGADKEAIEKIDAETIDFWIKKYGTFDALLEHLTLFSADPNNYFIFHTQHNSVPTDARPVCEATEEIIWRYYQDLRAIIAEEKAEGASLYRDRLELIIQFRIDFDLLHPFMDGNGRLGYLLLQKLLLENGFPPVMMPNPCIFAGYSAEQLVDIVCESMQTTVSYIRGEELKRHDLPVMTPAQKAEYHALQEETGLTAAILEKISSSTVAAGTISVPGPLVASLFGGTKYSSDISSGVLAPPETGRSGPE